MIISEKIDAENIDATNSSGKKSEGEEVDAHQEVSSSSKKLDTDDENVTKKPSKESDGEEIIEASGKSISGNTEIEEIDVTNKLKLEARGKSILELPEIEEIDITKRGVAANNGEASTSGKTEEIEGTVREVKVSVSEKSDDEVRALMISAMFIICLVTVIDPHSLFFVPY